MPDASERVRPVWYSVGGPEPRYAFTNPYAYVGKRGERAKAQHAAADYFDNHDGGEDSHWPQIIYLYASETDGPTSIWKVAMEAVPQFYAYEEVDHA